LGVPVFDADVILRFIINHKFYFLDSLKKDLGRDPMINGYIYPDLINDDRDFNILIDQVQVELFKSYDKYRRLQTYPYTIFMSSLIFERRWNEKFDIVINTFAPNDDRAFRARSIQDLTYQEFFNSVKTEFSQFKKNELSTHVIHSYNGGGLVEESVSKIDRDIKEKLKQLYSYASRG
jgi:dephospho-CoA kinase